MGVPAENLRKTVRMRARTRAESDPMMSNAWILVHLLSVFFAIVGSFSAILGPFVPTFSPFFAIQMVLFWLLGVIGFPVSLRLVLSYKFVSMRNRISSLNVEVNLSSYDRTVRKDRWKKAIKKEESFWTSDVFEAEWTEIKTKFSRILPELESKVRVAEHWKTLDVGCGPTVISRLFEKGEKFGIDPLISKFKTEEILQANAQFIRGRAEELPFKKNTFDLVICRNVLDHVEDPSNAVEEMERVMKKEGFLLISNVCYSSFVARLKKNMDKGPLHFLKEQFHPHYFTFAEFKGLCTTYFKITEEYEIHKGTNCLDTGKVVDGRIMDATRQNLVMSLIHSHLQYVRRRELAKLIELSLFYSFWYLVSCFNRVISPWYQREHLIVGRKL